MAAIATPKRTISTSPSKESGVTRYPKMGLAVTPHDTNWFAGPVTVRAGGAGIVNCVPEAYRKEIEDGGTPTDYDVPVTVPAGGDVHFEVCMVLASGTTATLIVASY